MAKQETEKPEKKELSFIETARERGYNLYFISAATEDLNNGAMEYVSIGFADANGSRQIFITLPKTEAIARAEAILKKYGNKK